MNKVLRILEGFIGYIEKQTPQDLDDKTKNAGNKNYTCFARDYKKYTGQDFQGQAWCAMFISVCFVIAYGLETAIKLLCGSLYAYCPFGMAAFYRKNRLFTKPKEGDIVFFIRNGVASHTGYVYRVNGDYIYTIEGNTSGIVGVVPNGGSVCKKYYKVDSNMRFGRPDYSIIEEEKVEETKETKKTKTQNESKTTQNASKSKNKYEGKETIDKLIKDLQKAVGVVVDGIVGPKTIGALPLLKKGSKGNVVKILQKILLLKGYSLPKYKDDGDFGKETENAVKKFQRDNLLKEDGEVGPKTWGKILA